jgi:hypothetical protein
MMIITARLALLILDHHAWGNLLKWWNEKEPKKTNKLKSNLLEVVDCLSLGLMEYQIYKALTLLQE